MVIRNKCYNTCFYLHDGFRIRKLFLVRHDTLRRLVMGGAYPYMDLNAINGKLLLRYLRQSIHNATFIDKAVYHSGRHDSVTLSPLLLQRGLRFGTIQRNGAAPEVIHTGFFLF
jgi:hypothetical protein